MAVIEVTCKELVEIVTDYLEGSLSRDQRLRFERHLASCDGCENYLDQMRETIRLVGRLSKDSIPLAARERLLAAYWEWKAS